MLCCWELNEIKPFNNEKGKTNSNHMLTMLKRGHKVECDYWSRAVVVPYTQAKWYFSLDSTPEGSLPCPNKGLLHCYDWLNPFLMLKKGRFSPYSEKFAAQSLKFDWLVNRVADWHAATWKLVLVVLGDLSYSSEIEFITHYGTGWKVIPKDGLKLSC